MFFIAGNKKEKQGSEILTMLLQALKNIVRSNSLPVQKILVSFSWNPFSDGAAELGTGFSAQKKPNTLDGIFLWFLTEGNWFHFALICGGA